MGKVISCQNLERTFLSYKKNDGVLSSLRGFFDRQYIEKKALQNLNLTVDEGIIVGLVGANGAGKTTLLKLLSGLIFPSSGSVEVLGFKPFDRDPAFLRQISILLGQKNQLWWDITPLDSFNLLATIYGIDDAIAEKRVHDLAEMLNCAGQLNIQLRRLSLGERMKMEIIGALLHKPKVLFLDEPTIGLDVVAQNSIRHFLENYVKEEKPTIILTSHYMDDIAKLANRLLLMKQGEIKYDGTVSEFMASSSQMQRLVCTFSRPAAHPRKLSLGMNIVVGQEVVQAEVPSTKLSEFLGELMLVGAIDQIRVEETDFEEVIRKFLEKDASVR
jgi:ABC-2 type transport system ATP-binding protein